MIFLNVIFRSALCNRLQWFKCSFLSFSGGGIDPKDFAKRLWGDMYFNSKS